MGRVVIAISGKQRSGKDTLAKILNDVLTNYTVVPLAKTLKEQYAEEHNTTVAYVEDRKNKMPNMRRALIDYGAKYREKDVHHWVKAALKHDGNIIIPDLRFVDEVDYICDNVDRVVLVRVEATRELRATRGVLSNESDASETDLDAFDGWDIVVENNGDLERLQQAADIIVDLNPDIV